MTRPCTTGKRAYANGAEAGREARKLRRFNKGTSSLKPYHCPHCGQFHLANGHGAGGRPFNQRAQKRRALKEIRP